MINRDGENIQYAETSQFVDKLNAEFYGKFPYPWPPMKFGFLEDTSFETVMLNQNMGAWDHQLLPENPRIWIAGCGTNQAILTALRFPLAQIVGSDISETSLEICARSARDLNIGNLELKRENLNDITYKDEFDYVISTGVIHHNAEPEAVLNNLVRALKSEGVIELMVYNKACWTLPANFQRAIRILCQHDKNPDYSKEYLVAQKLVNSFANDSAMAEYLGQFKHCPESMFADALLQPVMQSYTLESFNSMARRCQLELLQPYVNIFDKQMGTPSWNTQFDDNSIQEQYYSLSDLDRWKITNLMFWEKSPMLLWFYFQKETSTRKRKSEKEICSEFLQRNFIRAGTFEKNFAKRDGVYTLSDQSRPFPRLSVKAEYQAIVDAVDGRRNMEEIFKKAGMGLDFPSVNLARLHLTTSEYPFLKCIG